ncbi:6069_t:CDS:2 [Paraglomus brasilianum]|uniref:6069_t:CDS:1 n=1 Tax=Paraglomus brasilianum TaxID=144538 RepID=A0A9N9BFT3_9GLOM|nr:6069_t:CDS:2 [Paraglomus brasilianum]
MAPSSAFVTHMLQNPVPTYLLGTLPAILTIGAAPFSSLKLKVMHIFTCLACPFVGLSYFDNINNGKDENKQDVVDACVYWLNSNRFEGGVWPFGYRVQAIDTRPNNENTALLKVLRSCIANASVLDRFASLASAYYIVVGIALGIYRAAGPCDIQEWPIVAFFYYYLENRPPPGVNTDDYVYIWFQVWGFVVGVFLVMLGVLSNNPSYWVNTFGDSCDTSACFT